MLDYSDHRERTHFKKLNVKLKAVTIVVELIGIIDAVDVDGVINHLVFTE